ncbi:unnamed protein product [Prorocentrum cordatum]|uniref:Pyrrolo-quinoline quinone repeat domain-containing protein n=1 Tax=Prorocentrum cordatum TaxID=2364126 RepID=A0ABN9SKR5_9DINO|nr:unnamed protein product [Polarella glacialis]
MSDAGRLALAAQLEGYASADDGEQIDLKAYIDATNNTLMDVPAHNNLTMAEVCFESSELAARMQIRIQGNTNYASRKVRQVIGPTRGAAGVLQDLFVNSDQSLCHIKREQLVEQGRRACQEVYADKRVFVDRAMGAVSAGWKPIISIVPIPNDAPPTVQWCAANTSAEGIGKNKITDAIASIMSGPEPEDPERAFITLGCDFNIASALPIVAEKPDERAIPGVFFQRPEYRANLGKIRQQVDQRPPPPPFFDPTSTRPSGRETYSTASRIHAKPLTTMAAHALRAWTLQLTLASAFSLALRGNEEEEVGQVNREGVTRYQENRIHAGKSKDNWWPGATSGRNQEAWRGAADLTANISWGWHHPNGLYETIPIGGPMIDDEMNVYLATDDAIRKFSATGDLLWSYAPRGQVAAAPTLLPAHSSGLRAPRPRQEADGSDEEEEEEDALEAEEDVRPQWAANGSGAARVELLPEVKVGDRIRVRTGMGYHADGVEYFKAGDTGRVSNIKRDNGESKVYIRWPRTGYLSVTRQTMLVKRFMLLKQRGTLLPDMMVASTTNGYVFALAPATGEELWATKVSDKIAGVKGSVKGDSGVIVAATDLCINRYCYKYRNITNSLSPSNTIIRGLDAADGSQVWAFTPETPVWNFVPYFDGGQCFFTDFEGGAYSLNVLSGALAWHNKGTRGTYTQAAGHLASPVNQFYALGLQEYDIGDYCNPHGSPGILPQCSAGPGSGGYIKTIDTRSGNTLWTLTTPEPPAGAASGHMRFQQMHYRIVLTMGFNCRYSSKSNLWIIDPGGSVRLDWQGPTLWTSDCAGEVEAADVRRIGGGRTSCQAASWTLPVMDSAGDLFIGNQVGLLQKFSSPTDDRNVEVSSALSTGMAFPEQAIALSNGMMAVTTCTSLIVFQTYTSHFDQERASGSPTPPTCSARPAAARCAHPRRREAGGSRGGLRRGGRLGAGTPSAAPPAPPRSALRGSSADPRNPRGLPSFFMFMSLFVPL